MKKNILILTSIALLSACKGGGDTTSTTDGTTQPPTDPVASSDWMRGFVESFDPKEVAIIRNLAGFVANDLDYSFHIAGHPVYDTAQVVSSNPLKAARLDYALSTGLSGKGQVVAMVDDGIFSGHEQFAGKSITEEGVFGLGEHGTSVASVIAGTGQGGGAMGFAPAADLYVGTMNYSAGIDWLQQADFLKSAKAAGAIAINNSWTVDYDLYDGPASDLFTTSAGGAYIDALRDFAKTGIVIFSMQNDYMASNAHAMAAIPLSYPDLEESFLTAVNAIPEFDEDRIISATRISAGCMETGAYCLTGNGQVLAATNEASDSYGIATGTSFVAPQISGSMALLGEAFQDLSPQQLRARLLVTADNGWFDTTGSVEFADGISHGYNDEFGHGFINLRDALLPIGDTGIPVASAGGEADTIALGTAAIVASPLSGSALSASLASTSVVAIDALEGVFTLSGDAVASDNSDLDLSGYRLASLMAPNFRHAREAKNKGLMNVSAYGVGGSLTGSPDAFSLAGIEQKVMFVNDQMRIDLLQDEEGSIGIDYVADFALPSGQLELGFSALQERGSVLGMRIPGHERSVEGKTFEIGAGLSRRIAEGVGLRLGGRYGFADGDGAGMVGGFGGLAYDEMKVSIDLANVASSGDVLTFSASRPVGFSGGHVDMILPVAAASGSVTYADTKVDVASSDRQIDLALEYSAPLGRRGEMRLAVLSSFNSGHVSGRSDQSVLFGYSHRF